MTITEQVAKDIIRKLLKGDDYRIEIVTLIDAEFLQFVIDFFKKVVNAKLIGIRRSFLILNYQLMILLLILG